MKKSMKIAIAVGVGVVALGIVLGVVLGKSHREQAWVEYENNLAEIMQTRVAIEEFIDADVVEAKLSEDELQIWNNFGLACRQIDELYPKVLDSQFTGDSRELLSEQYNNLHTFCEMATSLELLNDGELDDEDIAMLKNSPNKILATYATDFENYRQKANEFNEAYGEVDVKKNDAMKKAYDELIKLGDELMRKYGKLSLEDILEMSRDDILTFYVTIELLQQKD